MYSSKKTDTMCLKSFERELKRGNFQETSNIGLLLDSSNAEAAVVPSVFTRLAVYGETKARKIKASFDTRNASPAKMVCIIISSIYLCYRC